MRQSRPGLGGDKYMAGNDNLSCHDSYLLFVVYLCRILLLNILIMLCVIYYVTLHIAALPPYS